MAETSIYSKHPLAATNAEVFMNCSMFYKIAKHDYDSYSESNLCQKTSGKDEGAIAKALVATVAQSWKDFFLENEFADGEDPRSRIFAHKVLIVNQLERDGFGSDLIEYAMTFSDYIQQHGGYGQIYCRVGVYPNGILDDVFEPNRPLGIPDVFFILGTDEFNKYDLYLFDFRYGVGTEVFPTNDQLRFYALMIATNHMPEGCDINSIRYVKTFVYQPRLVSSGEIFKEATLEVDGLRMFERNLKAKLTEEPVANPGYNQCRYCRVKHVCPDMLEMMNRFIELAGEYSRINEDLKRQRALVKKKLQENVDMSELENFVMDNGSFILKNGSIIKKMIDQVASTSKDMIESGTNVPGVYIKQAPFTRVLTEENAQALCRFYPKELIYKETIRTLGELEKSNVSKEHLTQFVTLRQGEPKASYDKNYKGDSNE